MSATTQSGPSSAPPLPGPRPWLAQVLCLLLLALLFAGSSWIRIHYTLHDPGFDAENPVGLLKSDPGLLYYITSRVIEAGGAIPENFRADPGPTWPDPADLPAMFAVGEEFLIAWAWRLFGGSGPLHVFIVKVMALLASIAVLAVYGLAHELTRSRSLALLAAALYVVLPYNYRTVGLVLLREDLSFPLYAIHLWLAARAVRTNTLLAWGLSGLALTLGLATWHALGFFLNLEVAALWLYLLRTGKNPCANLRLWPGLLALFVGGLTIPVLLAKNTLASPAVLGLCALILVSAAPRYWPRAGAYPRLMHLLGLGLLLGGARGLQALGWGDQTDYGHVTSFLRAKILTLGRLPTDPTALPFDVRLLWQGPFVTATWKTLELGLGAACLPALWALGEAAYSLLFSRGGIARLTLGAFFLLGIVSAWLVERTLILPALLAPCLAVFLAKQRFGSRVATGFALLLLLGQGAWFLPALGQTHQTWYQPPEYTRELRALVDWAGKGIPRGEGVLGDFVASTALLAEHGTPIVLQPKYETAESRRRIEDFYETFARGSLSDLATLMRRFRCRYLLVDRKYLWWGNRFIMGVPTEQQIPTLNTPAWHFIHTDARVLQQVPGFRLLYRSRPGPATDFFRVYQLLDGE